MISVNGDQFARELERDAELLAQDVLAAENELALELLAECQANTPVGPTPHEKRAANRAKDPGYGPLRNGWALSVGAPDPDTFGGEAALAGRAPGQPIYVQNNVFYASMVENGTVHAAPQPMAAPAIERLDKKVVRV